MKIPNLNTFADLVDRLIVEVNKLSYFENKKREEHAKDTPDRYLIAYWDNLSRDACEYRSLLKNEINKALEEVCTTGEYRTLNELRTFSRPPNTIADILADRCKLPGNNFIEELIKDEASSDN